jgi:hypothetical protein
MYYNGKTTTIKSGANTNDIINALELAVPTAVKEVITNRSNFPRPTGNPVKDAKQAAEFVRDNVKYKADGYLYQDIQLPARMIAGTKQADCKSFSLASVAQCLAAGHRCGFRFASYKPNKIPTHVYFWILDNSGKKFTFDPTIRNLKESPKATNTIDMELRYMTGVDDFPEIGKKGRGKKIFLAPARGAFLSLVALNVRGLATKLARSKNAKQFWEKLGGDYNKLKKAVDKAKGKKAIFGKGKGLKGIESTYTEYYDTYQAEGIGVVDLAAIGGFLATAGPVLIAVQNLFKKEGIPDGEEGAVITPDESSKTEPIDPSGQGFTVADGEGKTTPGTTSTSFKPSPLLIGGAIGAIALVYFLTSKKRR